MRLSKAASKAAKGTLCGRVTVAGKVKSHRTAAQLKSVVDYSVQPLQLQLKLCIKQRCWAQAQNDLRLNLGGHAFVDVQVCLADMKSTQLTGLLQVVDLHKSTIQALCIASPVPAGSATSLMATVSNCPQLSTLDIRTSQLSASDFDHMATNLARNRTLKNLVLDGDLDERAALRLIDLSGKNDSINIKQRSASVLRSATERALAQLQTPRGFADRRWLVNTATPAPAASAAAPAPAASTPQQANTLAAVQQQLHDALAQVSALAATLATEQAKFKNLHAKYEHDVAVLTADLVRKDEELLKRLSEQRQQSEERFAAQQQAFSDRLSKIEAQLSQSKS